MTINGNIKHFIDYLYKLERTGIKYSLKNITELMRVLGNPHESLNFIHVAGTNGKGAVASFAASILTDHGLKMGLFTSPHILKFNERIRINGKPIPDNYIEDFIKCYQKHIERIKPSFFEVNTALAFKYFADKKVDAAVVEAGLGGRLDSTNVINPLVTIITQIAIDHTEYLGKTLQSIAREKAGIIKAGKKTIVSDDHRNLRRIFEFAGKKTKLNFLDDSSNYRILRSSLNGSTFEFSGSKEIFRIPLAGEYQVRNAVTAIEAVRAFLQTGYEPVSTGTIRKGLLNIKKNSGYRCRLEHVKYGNTSYIFDISHNADGIKATLTSAEKLVQGFDKRIVIFGMMKEKDYKTSVTMLADFADSLVLTRPSYERALSAETINQYIREKGLDRKAKIYVTDTVKEALRKAGALAGKRDVIVITGSFFLVADAIKAAKLEKRFD